MSYRVLQFWILPFLDALILNHSSLFFIAQYVEILSAFKLQGVSKNSDLKSRNPFWRLNYQMKERNEGKEKGKVKREDK